MRSAVLSLFVLAAMAWGNAASADTVWATASGSDPVFDDQFWTIEYVSGSKVIETVIIDLSPLGGYFDFDGGGAPNSNYMNSYAPVITAVNGLTVPQITPVFVGLSPTSLTFNFASGSFAPGDSFSFAADWEGTLFDSGDQVAGALFTVIFEDATQFTMPFTYAGRDTSRASMPEPGMLALAGCGLIGIALRRRRRRNAA